MLTKLSSKGLTYKNKAQLDIVSMSTKVTDDKVITRKRNKKPNNKKRPSFDRIVSDTNRDVMPDMGGAKMSKITHI